MRRFWSRIFAGVAACGMAALLGPACVDNNASMFIYSVTAPPKPTDGACIITPDIKQLMLTSGTLDVALRRQYDAAFIIGSQLPAHAPRETPVSETSRITIQGTIVRITDSAGAELGAFTRLGSAALEPAAGASPGYTIFESTLIDPATTAKAIAGLSEDQVRRLVVYFRAFGETLGGQSVESSEFQFPVDLCFRCLIRFTSAESDPARASVDEPLNCAGKPDLTKAPCRIGQDQSVGCNVCTSTNDARDVCSRRYQPSGTL